MSRRRWLWCQMCGRSLTALQQEHGNGYCYECSPLQVEEAQRAPYRWEER